MQITIDLDENEVEAVQRLVHHSYGIDMYFRGVEYERCSDVLEKVLEDIEYQKHGREKTKV